MNKEEFIENVKLITGEVTTEQLELLDIYYQELVNYNKHTNLTAITIEEDVYLKHFYDSITLSKIIDLKLEETLLDIGSGAGFPGIVLKIFYPHLKVTLIDSNNKKTKFLEYIINKLNLKNIIVINDRVENFTKTNLNSFDIVTARAVTKLNILTELSMPLVKQTKYFIVMKANIDNEIEDGKYAIEQMHGKILLQQHFFLSLNENERTLIKIVKLLPTKLEEIRSYEKIVKKPLQKRL